MGSEAYHEIGKLGFEVRGPYQGLTGPYIGGALGRAVQAWRLLRTVLVVCLVSLASHLFV